MPSKPYPTRQLARNGPQVSAIGLGAMGIGSHAGAAGIGAFYGPSDKEESLKMLTYAADRGVTFWDTADVYGYSEEILGEWFQKTGRRSEIFLATKFGSREPGSTVWIPNSKPSYIRKAIARSFSKLKVDTIDLYYQHRVDPDVPIEVVMEVLGEFVKQGKIRYIGLSECNAETLRRAKAVPGVGEKLVAVQMEFGPFSLDIEKEDFMKAVEETGVSVVAYSPLNRGLATGRFRSRADFTPNDFRLGLPRFSEENFPKNLTLVDKLQSVAEKTGHTSAQVTLAWIMAEYSNAIPIPGCRNIPRLEENAAAAEVKLSSEYVKEIRKLANEADNVAGSRYTSLPQGECIPLNMWNGEK